MAVQKLSQIALAATPPALTDTVVGVRSGNTDQQFTLAQIARATGFTVFTGDTNFYVSTTGSDITGDGLTPATAWLTLQHAINILSSQYFFSGFTGTLNVGAGTFVGFGMKSMQGGGNLIVQGAGSASTTIAAGPNDGIFNFGDAVTHNVQCETILSVDKVKLTSNIGFGIQVIASGIIACLGNFLTFTGADIVFGPAVGAAMGMFGPALMLTAPGNYSINMGASCAHFLQLANFGQMQLDGTFTCVGSTNFTTAFQTVFGNSSLFWISFSFVNPSNFTGIRFHVFGEGYANTSGLAVASFPGSLPSVIQTGGNIDADVSILGPELLLMQGDTFSNLPSPVSSNAGLIGEIVDSFIVQYGQIVTGGGGTNRVILQSDGTNWRVVSSFAIQRLRLTAATTVFISNFTGTVVGGSGYVSATYGSVPLTGGSGSGATADIQVIGGVVTYVSVRPVSSTYIVGDVLSASNANLGGSGSGFTYTITAIGSDTFVPRRGFVATLPWATAQAAYQWCKNNLDVNGQVLTFQFSDGVFGGIDTFGVFPGPEGWVGEGYLQLFGNGANIDAVVLDGQLSPASSSGTVLQAFVEVGILINIANMQLRNDVGSQILNLAPLNDRQGISVFIQNYAGVAHTTSGVRFKYRGAAGGTTNVIWGISASLTFASSCPTTLDYTDTGASSQRSFLDVDFGGFVNMGTTAVTISGTATYSDAFLKLTGRACIFWNSTTSLPGCTGKRFFLNPDTLLETFGNGVTGLAGNTLVGVFNGGDWFDGANTTYTGAAFFQYWAHSFSALPTAPAQGMVATITDGLAGNCGDGTCTTFGTTVTGGGGALPLLIWWNGTNWTLFGK